MTFVDEVLTLHQHPFLAERIAAAFSEYGVDAPDASWIHDGEEWAWLEAGGLVYMSCQYTPWGWRVMRPLHPLGLN